MINRNLRSFRFKGIIKYNINRVIFRNKDINISQFRVIIVFEELKYSLFIIAIFMSKLLVLFAHLIFIIYSSLSSIWKKSAIFVAL